MQFLVVLLLLDCGIAQFRLGIGDPHYHHAIPVSVWFTLSFDTIHDENRSDCYGALARLLIVLENGDGTLTVPEVPLSILPLQRISNSAIVVYHFLAADYDTPPPRA